MKLILTILLTVLLTSCTTTNPETGEEKLTAWGAAWELLCIFTDDDKPETGTIIMDDGRTYRVIEEE